MVVAWPVSANFSCINIVMTIEYAAVITSQDGLSFIWNRQIGTLIYMIIQMPEIFRRIHPGGKQWVISLQQQQKAKWIII